MTEDEQKQVDQAVEAINGFWKPFMDQVRERTGFGYTDILLFNIYSVLKSFGSSKSPLSSEFLERYQRFMTKEMDQNQEEWKDER